MTTRVTIRRPPPGVCGCVALSTVGEGGHVEVAALREAFEALVGVVEEHPVVVVLGAVARVRLHRRRCNRQDPVSGWRIAMWGGRQRCESVLSGFDQVNHQINYHIISKWVRSIQNYIKWKSWDIMFITSYL